MSRNEIDFASPLVAAFFNAVCQHQALQELWVPSTILIPELEAAAAVRRIKILVL